MPVLAAIGEGLVELERDGREDRLTLAAGDDAANLLVMATRLGAATRLGKPRRERSAGLWPTREGVKRSFSAVRPKCSSSASVRKRDAAPADRRINGDILVHGILTVVQGLIEQDLVDELRLLVYPVVLDTGRRLSARSTTSAACA
jgi:hypothetical protein